MDEPKKQEPNVTTEPDVEEIVFRESEEALRRFRAGDFAGNLKSRSEAPLPGLSRQPFFFFRKPVFAPALGLLLLAAGTLSVFIILAGNRGKSRVDAGFRNITESLSHFEMFRAGGLPPLSGNTGIPSTGGDIRPFAMALFRAAAGSAAETAPESAAPTENGAPLRPLFSPNERFKILYEDRVIFRVLVHIANQKEV